MFSNRTIGKFYHSSERGKLEQKRITLSTDNNVRRLGNFDRDSCPILSAQEELALTQSALRDHVAEILLDPLAPDSVKIYLHDLISRPELASDTLRS
ncbi:MAG: hypothetical protein KDD53_00480 [Bdellovibrionales bacterium]|nr:hypothetical protein [Bdellovibrionales bacterium]